MFFLIQWWGIHVNIAPPISPLNVSGLYKINSVLFILQRPSSDKIMTRVANSHSLSTWLICFSHKNLYLCISEVPWDDIFSWLHLVVFCGCVLSSRRASRYPGSAEQSLDCFSVGGVQIQNPRLTLSVTILSGKNTQPPGARRFRSRTKLNRSQCGKPTQSSLGSLDHPYLSHSPDWESNYHNLPQDMSCYFNCLW